MIVKLSCISSTLIIPASESTGPKGIHSFFLLCSVHRSRMISVGINKPGHKPSVNRTYGRATHQISIFTTFYRIILMVSVTFPPTPDVNDSTNIIPRTELSSFLNK